MGASSGGVRGGASAGGLPWAFSAGPPRGWGRPSSWRPSSEAGKDDLCSSILDPWHFMSISKKDSSGNWSFAEVATLNRCKISGCFALFRPVGLESNKF